MSATIECAFVNSIITADWDFDRDTRAGTKNITIEPCAQQGIMEKRISELRMMWLSRSAARDRSEYDSPLLHYNSYRH